MHLYEVVNPSDETTFSADSDAIATVAVAMVSTNYCAKRDGFDGYIFTSMRDEDCEKVLSELTGIEGKVAEILDTYIPANAKSLVDALRSFAYISLEERRIYDAAIEAITEPKKLAEFKAQHEDRNRSSMNQICKRAWAIADSLQKKHLTANA